MAASLDWAVTGPPIGTWTTVVGTFDTVMQDTLTLAGDGTGWLLTRSPLRGAELFPVMWRHPGPGRLDIATLEPDDDPTEAPLYEAVHYAAREVESDVGLARPVLCNQDGDTFWTLVGPLELTDPTPQSPPEPSRA